MSHESQQSAVANPREFTGFANLDVDRHPSFLPGGAKYLDLPGMIALGSSRPLWLAGQRDALALPAGGATDATWAIVSAELPS